VQYELGCFLAVPALGKAHHARPLRHHAAALRDVLSFASERGGMSSLVCFIKTYRSSFTLTDTGTERIW
jgi:hypothetical protein